MVIIFILIGLFIGAGLEGFEGALVGAALGFCAGLALQLRNQLEQLSQKHQKLQNNFTQLSQHYEQHQFNINKTEAPKTQAKDIFDEVPESTVEPLADDSGNQQPNISTPETTRHIVPNFDNNISKEIPVTKTVQVKESKVTRKAPVAAKSNPIIEACKKFIFDGNPIVKIASIVLFFGVAFLLKYAAEQNYFPIEWRFISIAIAAIGLLIWGLKLTPKQRQYGLVIQGLGIGILYLTTYAASSVYYLLPLNIAFILLLILSVSSAILAIKQDASSLAIIAVVGGFLAPILTSSGSNAYVKLFSYYAILNIGILIVSLFKSWRFLSWLGFVFTFIIGSFWGYQAYRPEYFSNTEPFLIFHFLLYLSVPILFLRLKQSSRKPIIQISVVFGLASISFLLQLYLVKEIEHGDTYSALTWSIAYFIACFVIHLLPNKDQVASKTLLVSYAAIAIIFFSLFIFYLFSQDITSVLWALEAVGLSWLGIKQKEFFPKIAGLALITLSTLLYLDTLHFANTTSLFLNAQYLSGLLIALSALTIGFFYHKGSTQEKTNSHTMSLISLVLLVSASFLTLFIGANELSLVAIDNYFLPSLLLYISLIAFVYFVVSQFIRWKTLGQAALFIIPSLVLITVLHFVSNYQQNPLAFLGYLAYPVAIGVSYFIIERSLVIKNISQNSYSLLASSNYLAITFIATWSLAYFAKGQSVNGDWFILVFGLFPSLALIRANHHANKLAASDLKRDAFVYTKIALFAYVAIWTLINTFSILHPNNIPFISLLNPLDLSLFLALYSLYITYKSESSLQKVKIANGASNYLIFIAAFVFINMLIARSFHHYSGVPFNMQHLFSEPNFQLTLTVAWSLIATTFMYFAKTRQSRQLWIGGAILLVAILIKLVLFDMADSGTLSRIISFLVVGTIMLAIGYFVPMPPNESEEQNTKDL